MMKKGHFLYSAFTALHGQLPVPEDVVYEGSRLLALCEAGSHASLPTRRAMAAGCWYSYRRTYGPFVRAFRSGSTGC